MKSKNISASGLISKIPTGITGLDKCLNGGLPKCRNTLLVGGPGSGKTVLALQTLVNGARLWNEPGIFVAFEEKSDQIISNAGAFGWDLPELQKRKLFFLDAKMQPDIIKAGEFDLTATLAVISEKARTLKAKRIVFDSIDVLLSLLDNPSLERKELYRLYDWLLSSGMTGIITAKSSANHNIPDKFQYYNMQFMADCVIHLGHELSNDISVRNLWILKYRGSSFIEKLLPATIGEHGFDISSEMSISLDVPVSRERISSGIDRLDTMLNGGYIRGTSVLITGAPGTAKSTLAAAFTDVTCKSGGRVIYVSFDSSDSELVRNFESVNIHLGRHLRSGRLKIHSVIADACSSKEHMVQIRKLIDKYKPGFIIIDPLSALIKSGGLNLAQNIAERLIIYCRSVGITVIHTSLLNESNHDNESTPINVSTIADTWIHLSYQINAGERNRALTIIKARGTKHSNQVRELMLSDKGITLTDAYTSGGEVLMGTMRWQKEHADKMEEERVQAEMEIKRRESELAYTELSSRLKLLEREMDMKKAELDLLNRTELLRKERIKQRILETGRQRDVDKSNKTRRGRK